MVESDKLLVGSDNENGDEKMIVLDDENLGEDDPFVPTIGMKFKDET